MDLPHSQPLWTLLSGRKAITGDTHYVDGGFHILA